MSLQIILSKSTFANNSDSGNLETLLLSTLDKNNSVLNCFDKYSECLKEKEDIFEKALDKAKLHAYTMFSQKGENLYKPHNSFVFNGKDTGLWNIEHEAFKPFVQFIVSFITKK